MFPMVIFFLCLSLIYSINVYAGTEITIRVDKSGNVFVCNADNGSLCRQQSNATVKFNSVKGYCTSLPTKASFGVKIVNDHCNIVVVNNNYYKLIWSNGRQTRITINPAAIDGNYGKLIKRGQTFATIKTKNEKIGFCWNCYP